MQNTIKQLFPIKSSERALLIGKTGSGKSTLAERLLHIMPNPVIIDSKAEWEFPNSIVIEDPRKLSEIRQGDNRPVIFAPAPEYDEYEIYDAVFHWVYLRKNSTLYIDELFAVFKQGQPNRWLRACLTRGRSRNIATLCATQRPRNIPLEVLSETDHRFIFNLDLLDDKKRVSELIGPKGLVDPNSVRIPGEEGKGRYQFWYKYQYSDDPAKVYKLQTRG